MRLLRYNVLLVLCLFCLCLGAEPLRPNSVSSAPSADSVTGFLDQSVVVDGKTASYALYVPDDYNPAKAWPLIVFLHGAGERGKDNLLQTDVGIGHAIRQHRDWFPALVLMPQCPEGKFWDSAIPVIEAALAQTRALYHIDDRAITLTGLSMGGYATWIWGALKTDTFAALMPICGGGNPEDLRTKPSQQNLEAMGTLDERVKKLSAVPIWAFHGADDDVVPVDRTKDMVQRVKAAGGDVEYTEFEDTGHNSWDTAYGKKKTIHWLLKQRRK